MAMKTVMKASKQVLESPRSVEKPPTPSNSPTKGSKDQQTAKLTAQRAEFMDYLTRKVDNNPGFKFASDMFQKLVKGETLTENMEKAVRNCMEQDRLRSEKEEAELLLPKDPKDLPKVTLVIKPWFMRQRELHSSAITGVILRETQKAYQFKGHADMVEGTWCMRCGLELTEPASMLIGFGPTCCKRLGIPYPRHILTASKAERKKLREEMITILHAQEIETWIPKSQVIEVIENTKERKF